MSLSDEYRVAVARADLLAPTTPNPTGKVHAVMQHADTTICGKIDALDVVYVKPLAPGHSYVVTCGECLAALKRERQRRSREGTARAAERRAQQVEDEAVALRDRAYALADALYNTGYDAGFHGTGCDPRGTPEWEAVVEAITGEQV